MKNRTILVIAFSLINIIARAQFFTQSIQSDLNQHSSGFAAYASSQGSLNIPTDYGSVLGLRFWDGGGSDWRTQLAFGTDNNFYYRQSTNNSGNTWTSWYKMWHSGNLNRSDADFTCKNFNSSGTIQTINKDTPGATWDNLSLWSNGSNSYIYANGDEKGLYIKSIGGNKIILESNVGIGTYNPQNLLDVNGTIHAREVKVDLTGWSDFVFHPSYQLKPLTEVEKFIKDNGHLQDIPSAAEVEQNGVNVGEMQTKLLQKVEELTLYTIELNKKLEEQTKINKELMEKVDKMEKDNKNKTVSR
jgi:hypothetical protein